MSKRKLFFTNTNKYEVRVNPDGSLFITSDGVNSIENAGLFIKNCGGIASILSHCTDSTIGIEEYKKLLNEEKQKETEYSEAEKLEFKRLVFLLLEKHIPSRDCWPAIMEKGFRIGFEHIKLHPEKGWMQYTPNMGWEQVGESCQGVIKFRREHGLPDYDPQNRDESFKQRFNRNMQYVTQRLNREKEEDDAYQRLTQMKVIPTTAQNISILLSGLNKQNWGSWELPKMSIGYHCEQYDCNGVIATTITLDEPISDEELGIIQEKKFVVGAPFGHLTEYCHVRW